MVGMRGAYSCRRRAGRIRCGTVIRRLASLGTVAALCGAVSCAEDGEPEWGETGTCERPQGGLLGCPPPGQPAPPFDESAACFRLVRCGVIPLERFNMDGAHYNDYPFCVNQLTRYPPDRLAYTLRCIQTARCSDLFDRNGPFNSPCFKFGAKP